MNLRLPILGALALLAAPLAVAPATALEEASVQSVQAFPRNSGGGLGRGVITDARAKGFRSSNRVLVVALNCNAAGYPNATRVDFITCSVLSDTGFSSNSPGSFPAPAGAQVARVNLPGNRLVRVCVRAIVYFNTGTPSQDSGLNCSGSILFDV